ncbi:hypothetical protein NNJEOMEG_03054 [Fundidesulfovibrio magnetotacticus]|uniref:Uncharacterized protein n=1 Tax=Fundidesulfovibrio magnetotacticus TaxID=2730080 RepID=A0A6V8LZI6_9BACT|nr:hypothetical protein [Fundidesulfovibrio magnetotacticus]GFK95196.1 hypothetical protein NNJEOMEG_03054 [Fundidesulfovibrio magnetotacticus]
MQNGQSPQDVAPEEDVKADERPTENDCDKIKKIQEIIWSPFQTGKNTIASMFGSEACESKFDNLHDEITAKVFRRLVLRHGVLGIIERLSSCHEGNKFSFKDAEDDYLLSLRGLASAKGFRMEEILAAQDVETTEKKHAADEAGDPEETKAEGKATCCEGSRLKESESGMEQAFLRLPNTIRNYNLAVTDLFVEKALAYLSRKSDTYKMIGYVAASAGVLLMTVAIYYAHQFVFSDVSQANVSVDITHNIYGEVSYTKSIHWSVLVSGFIKTFTLFGLLVTMSVFSYRMAKALWDQAERIKDRRHALRQGRLFVHLNGGKLTIEEMERAFNWNVTQENAFSQFNSEAQAPWGNVVKELIITLRETAKASAQAIKNARDARKE